MTASTAEQNAAYRAGLCIDCRTAPHSAGRPRCNACHQTYNDDPLKGAVR